jgi:hypothetical protein
VIGGRGSVVGEKKLIQNFVMPDDFLFGLPRKTKEN